jgi:hypothetical protein
VKLQAKDARIPSSQFDRDALMSRSPRGCAVQQSLWQCPRSPAALLEIVQPVAELFERADMRDIGDEDGAKRISEIAL